MKQFVLLLFSIFTLASVQAQPAILHGWAENAVNVSVFRSNSLVTHGDTQFIAYYDADGYVCIGKRTLGTENWDIRQTAHKGNQKDAHNCISIMTDGAGFLHVAWNHHDTPLNYTKSTSPLSLDLEAPQPMTGRLEDRVTYPGFYKTANGNLLFMYRERQSGKGNLVLNAYDTKSKKWLQVHDNLIDGEGARSAYWQTCIDTRGVVHLSWVWRESPDVASNHDMCYARSTDGGKTWINSKGKKYKLPITAQTAEYAARIPQSSELINQTSMTADKDGKPYIATYYRQPDSQIPQYHLIYLDKKNQWQTVSLDFRKTPFTLKGGGTKKIPIARPQLVIDEEQTPAQWLLIFRDAERGSRVSVASSSDLQANQWHIRDLTDYSVESWEPTYDTELWENQHQLHLFVQKAGQEDGERNSNLSAQPVSVLNVPRHCRLDLQSPENAVNIIRKVNDYWQSTHPTHGNAFWHRAAYHTGNLAAYEATKEERYRAYSEAWAAHNEWKGAKSDNPRDWKYQYGETDAHVLFGDWQICFQVYADLYNLAPDVKKIARAREVMEYEMSTPNSDYWWWADGLYMVMPVMTRLHKLTGNALYLNKLYEYFSFADSVMFDHEAGLYYRDARYVYPKHQTASGKKDFWARGDGWVFAGLARVLADLPKEDAHREQYIQRYKAMAKTLKASQQAEGYWTRSLLDAEFAPGPETSGTAFFTYGYLWGINNGYLDRAEYWSVVEKAWNYLTTVALQPDGKVGYVQPIGDKAIPGQVIDRNSTADFGVGAFLLAAAEMLNYTNSNDRAYWTDLAYRIAAPVLSNMSKGELKKNMQVEVSPTWDGRNKDVTYMECFGRLMSGIAPWLSLPDDDTDEGKQRKQLREWALKSYAHAVNPQSPDYLLWRNEGQPLVDAAYIAGSFLRAPEQLWQPLDEQTKSRYIAEFQQLRRIDPPNTNWLLFSAMIETFLMQADAQYDMYRIHSAIRKIEDWYVGDGWYSDGEHFAFDYYNSYVIQPMYVQVLQVLTDRKIRLRDKSLESVTKNLDDAKKRMQRYGMILERFISPEASFPTFGRSMTYRLGVFQPLSLLAWKEQLPKELPEGQVRNALTSVMKRMFSQKGNFNDKGFLQLGFAGHQPDLADWYTNNGSMYLTSEVFLPLGLPANHSFWTTPPLDWTGKKAWNGKSFPKDHAIR